MNKQFIVISALCAFVVGAPVYAEEVLPSKGSLFAKKPTLFAQYRGIQNGLGDNHEPFTLIYSRFLNEKSVKVTTDEKMVLFEELEHRGVTPLMLGKVRLFSRSVDKELKRFPWLAVGLTAAAFIGVAMVIMYQRHAQAAPPADGEDSGLATEGTQSSWLASTSWGKAISKWWYGDVAAQPDDNTPPRPHANSDASGEADGGGRSVPLVPAGQNAASGTSADYKNELQKVDFSNVGPALLAFRHNGHVLASKKHSITEEPVGFSALNWSSAAMERDYFNPSRGYVVGSDVEINIRNGRVDSDVVTHNHGSVYMAFKPKIVPKHGVFDWSQDVVAAKADDTDIRMVVCDGTSVNSGLTVIVDEKGIQDSRPYEVNSGLFVAKLAAQYLMGAKDWETALEEYCSDIGCLNVDCLPGEHPMMVPSRANSQAWRHENKDELQNYASPEVGGQTTVTFVKYDPAEKELSGMHMADSCAVLLYTDGSFNTLRSEHPCFGGKKSEDNDRLDGKRYDRAVTTDGLTREFSVKNIDPNKVLCVIAASDALWDECGGVRFKPFSKEDTQSKKALFEILNEAINDGENPALAVAEYYRNYVADKYVINQKIQDSGGDRNRTKDDDLSIGVMVLSKAEV